MAALRGAERHSPDVFSGLVEKKPHHVDEFIGDRLIEKELVTAVPCENKEEEENDHTHLHGLQCLVAGAIQE